MIDPRKLAIGCSRAGSLSNPTPLHETEKMWREAVAAGCIEFDTADIYAQGDSELALGRLLRAMPHKPIQVTTKAGFVHGGKSSVVRLAKPLLRPLAALNVGLRTVKRVRSSIDQQNFDPKYLSERVRSSKKRLGVESLHGFLLHDPPLEVLTRPETSRFLQELKTSGSAHRVGVSLKDESTLVAALNLGPIDLLQLPVSAYEKILGTGLIEEISARGIRLTLRQVLNRPDGVRPSVNEALPSLLADPGVSSILVGISRIENLRSTLKALSS